MQTPPDGPPRWSVADLATGGDSQQPPLLILIVPAPSTLQQALARFQLDQVVEWMTASKYAEGSFSSKNSASSSGTVSVDQVESTAIKSLWGLVGYAAAGALVPVIVGNA